MPVAARAMVTWSARHVPLEPRAVLGTGAAAARLGRRLLDLDDRALGGLVAVAGPAVFVVIGAGHALPWADGVVYLGRAPDAPRLLVPTHLEPDAPYDLIERALIAAHPELVAPVAVIVDPPQLISVGVARSIDRGRLAEWLAP